MNRNARLPEAEELTEVVGLDPLVIVSHFGIEYEHSYAQDSPWFAALAEGRLLGSRCAPCGCTYATPRGHCMRCGGRTEWVELPLEGKVHTWTTCYYAGESFRKETPYHLVLVEFDGADTLLMARLVGCERDEIRIGMPVRARFRRRPQWKPTDVYFVPV
ncbi:MAG: Zn-ribbon domain-containing OB-fold protein [Armatimonadota bacterium]